MTQAAATRARRQAPSRDKASGRGAMPASLPEMAGCTCMRLRKLTRRVTQIYDGYLAAAGLSSPQFGLLAVINRRPGISMRELADFLVMDPTTLTRNLRPLQDLGHVEVVADKTDRRRRAITLTRKGQATFVAAVPHWRKAQAHTAQQIGSSDLAALTAAVDQSMAKLSAAGTTA